MQIFVSHLFMDKNWGCIKGAAKWHKKQTSNQLKKNMFSSTSSTTMIAALVVVFVALPYKLLEPVHALIDAERNSIRDIHNQRRSELANGMTQNKTGMMPTARNIYTMVYDTALEAQAQSWTSQCTGSHSSTTARNGAGENGCFFSAQQTNVAQAMKTCADLWWAELVQYGAPSNLVLTEANWQPTGHWSQMAWHATRRLGCGIAYCPNHAWKTQIFCQYTPAGNYMNQKVYEPGAVCSGCPVVNGQLQCQYGLCKV